ncbi:pyridoxal phosphate-dependent transferase, partial [Catenaria anguillulae PL171]
PPAAKRFKPAILARRLLSTSAPPGAVDEHLIPLYAKPQDLTLVRGQGALLFDTNGRRFIDFTAGIAVCSLGHADPQIAEVLYDQAKTWSMYPDFHNAFHGRSMGALSATPNRKYQALLSHLCPARDALELGGYCGILVEPFQGEGGIYPATTMWAEPHGRKWGHHWFPANAAPDVVTCAKPLGNGVPIGAVLTTAKVSSSLHPGAHGTTFGGNPLACRVAAHIMDRLTAPDLLTHVSNMGKVVQHRLTGMQSALGKDVVTNVRGMGLIAGLELASGDLAKKVVDGCRERGLLICTAGKAGNVMRIVPPLVIEQDVLEEGLAVLEEVVGNAAK